MKTRLLTFFDMLRDVGLPITVAETLDALNAVRVVGVERRAFRDGLAAALVKDEADRHGFDSIFDRCFPLVGKMGGKSRQHERIGDASGHGVGKSQQQPQPGSREVHDNAGHRNLPAAVQHSPKTPREAEASRHRQLSGKRRLQALEFEQMSPRDIQDCDALVAELAQRFRAHLARRLRYARRGRLDIRRTLRRSISTGGVPLQPAFRQRRPGAPDLVGLCDCSHSVATATQFLLGLLEPAPHFFRRVRLFAFVDQPIEISIENGLLVPHERLDLHARSDFGRVLVGFSGRYNSLLNRNSILLILGDARNNRRPSRADVLGRMRNTVRRVVWLNPEPLRRWNSGDSVIGTYGRHCDDLLSASTPREMFDGLRHGLEAK